MYCPTIYRYDDVVPLRSLKYKHEHENTISEDERETIILSILIQYTISDVAKIIIEYDAKLLNKLFKYPDLNFIGRSENYEEMSVIENLDKFENLHDIDLKTMHDKLTKLRTIDDKFEQDTVLKIIEFRPIYIKKYFKHSFLYPKIIKFLIRNKVINSQMLIINYNYFVSNQQLFVNPALSLLFIDSSHLLNDDSFLLLTNKNPLLRKYQLKLYYSMKLDMIDIEKYAILELDTIDEIRQDIILDNFYGLIKYAKLNDVNILAKYMLQSFEMCQLEILLGYPHLFNLHKAIGVLLSDLFVAYLIDNDYNCVNTHVSYIFRICSGDLAPHVLKLKYLAYEDYENILSNKDLFEF